MGYFKKTYTETPNVSTTTRLPRALEGFIIAAEILAQKPFSWYLSWEMHVRRVVDG